jgi:hypothetical protein
MCTGSTSTQGPRRLESYLERPVQRVVLRQQYASQLYGIHLTCILTNYSVYTKKSQWEKPNEPAYPAGEAPLNHAPPGYAPGAVSATPSEKSTFGSNNPYANISEDEKLARKLQDEEEARARGHGPGAGASNNYYTQPGQAQHGGYPDQQYGQQQTPYDAQTQDKGKSKGGLLGKLLGKASGHSSSSAHGYPQQQQGYGQPYGAPMGGGQYYAQPGRPMMGGMGGMGGGRRPGGGMGAGGAMALGAGGGLLGGALLGSAMADAGDGGGYGGDGGDFGGDGGGDFGGDGGGDFGGGDMGGGD